MSGKITKASHRDVIAKPVRLKHGNDAKVAAELDNLISEADDGLRRILKVGFFIECIDADLPWGLLEKWVEQHLPHRKFRTIQRWKQVAQNVGECVGIKLKDRLELKLHEVVSLPVGDLSGDAKDAREKIEAEIEGKTYRQLFLQFKQSKDGEKPHKGRRKGEGGATVEQRHAHKIKLQELDLKARETRIRNVAEACADLAADAGALDPELAEVRAECFPGIAKLYRLFMDLEQKRGA